MSYPSLCAQPLLALLFAISIVTPAAGLPIVSVDVTGATPGIDAFAEVAAGDSITVDILIEGLDGTAGEALNAYEFDLVFDAAVLSVASVSPGGSLLAPSFVIQNAVGAMSVEYAEITLLPAGLTGDGVLASITFDTIADGTSALDLENVLLSAPFGIPIAAGGIIDGTVQVGAATQPIPEPGAALLFGAGLIVASRQIQGFRRAERW